MIIKLISIYLFIGVMLLSFLFVNSFLRGKSSYAKMLGALSITLQVYLLGYLMELNTSALKEMLFWNQIQYFGIPFFPALWLAVSMLYTGRGKYLQGFRSLGVFAIPLMTFVIRMTNNWHHLYYSRIELQQVGGTNLMLSKERWGRKDSVQIASSGVSAALSCTDFSHAEYRRNRYRLYGFDFTALHPADQFGFDTL